MSNDNIGLDVANAYYQPSTLERENKPQLIQLEKKTSLFRPAEENLDRIEELNGSAAEDAANGQPKLPYHERLLRALEKAGFEDPKPGMNPYWKASFKKAPPPPPARELPPEAIAELKSQLDTAVKGNPTLDPAMSFISDANQERLEEIFEALLTMEQGLLREDLLFCYLLVQRAQIENFKLKKECRKYMEYALKTKLLEQKVSLR